MIVWSKGLGKQRLPLALADATLVVNPGYLAMEGNIEPVCWDYRIKLGPNDLRDFLRLMAQPQTARFLAERKGVLAPFVGNLLVMAPRVVWAILTQWLTAPFRKGKPS